MLLITGADEEDIEASEGEEVVEVEETDPREKVATMRKRMAMMKARMV